MPSDRITPEIQAAYDKVCQAERELMELMEPLCTADDFTLVVDYMVDCGDEEFHSDNPVTYSYIFSNWEIEGEDNEQG